MRDRETIETGVEPAAELGAWWEARGVAVALVLLSALPLLWPALPPLGDLPGHMGRWHIAMTLDGSPDLQRYFTYGWTLIPNLGLDLLVPAIAPVVGFEPAAKLAVVAIPMLTVVGVLWAAREAHGRVPPTAMIAMPLAYAWPFQLGFVNFALAQALAFCALALWIRLGRWERPVMRTLVFVPIACALWIAHSFGWGVFGLMVVGAELARLRLDGAAWRTAVSTTLVRCLPLAVPVAVMIGTARPSPGGPIADDWFDLPAKAIWMISILRDRWRWFDIASLLVPLFVLLLAERDARLRFSPVLAWPALLCLAAFITLPRLAMGGAYVDARMAPAALMLAVIAIAPPLRAVRFARLLAALAMTFVAVRSTGTTISFVLRAGEQQRELAAIPRIPHGAAVLALVARPCGDAWSDARLDQLPSMAIVRRDVFTNAQWAIAGQQSLRVRYAPASPYLADPSQMVLPQHCRAFGSDFAGAIEDFPRAAFTHVWTIGFPAGTAMAPDLHLVWSNHRSALYRVVR